MKNIYKDTRLLDSLCRSQYGLSEELMMENAAAAMEAEVVSYIDSLNTTYINRPAVLILCGKGNNGADGYALARRLSGKKINVIMCQVFDVNTQMSQIQMERACKTGCTLINIMELDDYIERLSVDLKVIADCIFGSGFHGNLPSEAEAVISSCNAVTDALKIACDIPSGMAFKADITVTMGALKTILFSDKAKEMCGNIKVASLGVSSTAFEACGNKCEDGKILPEAQLLEKCDLKLPFRNNPNVHKGTFGHAVAWCGEKKGAAVLSAKAALKFGAGLSTLVVKPQENFFPDPELMYSPSFPETTSSIAFGMGMGRDCSQDFNTITSYILQNNTSFVCDADAFYYPEIKDFLTQCSLKKINGVLTPHPKEFMALLENCSIIQKESFTLSQIIENKVQLLTEFCTTFPEITIVLKGANVFIARKSVLRENVNIYINPIGTPSLSKAGSGDVLSGMINALLAQKNNSLQSAVHSSLAHSLTSTQINNNYSLTPLKIIEALETLSVS